LGRVWGGGKRPLGGLKGEKARGSVNKEVSYKRTEKKAFPSIQAKKTREEKWRKQMKRKKKAQRLNMTRYCTQQWGLENLSTKKGEKGREKGKRER